MKNKARDLYITHLLQQQTEDFPSGISVMYFAADQQISLESCITEYSYGYTSILADFDGVAEFCDVLEINSASDLAAISGQQLQNLYNSGKACVLARFDRKLDGRTLSFWKASDNIVVTAPDGFPILVPKEFQDPETWKPFADHVFEEMRLRQLHELREYLDNPHFPLTKNNLEILVGFEETRISEFEVISTHVLELQGTITSNLLQKQITVSVGVRAGKEEFIEILKLGKIDDLDKITPYHLIKYYREGIGLLRLSLCIGLECYQLKIHKTNKTAQISNDDGYEQIVTNFEDTEAELFEIMEIYLAEQGINLQKHSFSIQDLL